VMEIRKRVLGEEHPDTLTSMSNLAYAFRDLGPMEEAKDLLAHSLDISLNVLGDDHPLIIQRSNSKSGITHSFRRWAHILATAASTKPTLTVVL